MLFRIIMFFIMLCLVFIYLFFFIAAVVANPMKKTSSVRFIDPSYHNLREILRVHM